MILRATVWLFGLLFFLTTLKSQEIFEADRPMSLGLKPAQILVLPLNDVRSIEKLWEDYMKDQGLKLKRNRKADEYYSTEAELFNIGGGQQIEFYSRIEENQNESQLSVWIHLKDGFLNEADNPDETQSLRELILPFENVVRIEKVQRELENEEEMLKGLNKELEKLQSDKQKYERSIEEAKQEILENEENIRQNLKEQESMQQKIEEQKIFIQKVQTRMDELRGK
jgi:chromosome segregation ATPase